MKGRGGGERERDRQKDRGHKTKEKKDGSKWELLHVRRLFVCCDGGQLTGVEVDGTGRQRERHRRRCWERGDKPACGAGRSASQREQTKADRKV